MRNLIIVALLLAALPFFAIAQSNYHAGYVIRNNGDTVKGYINYQEWSNSPKNIQFKPAMSNQRSTTLNVTTLKSFHIEGYDDYLRYEGPVSTGKVHTTDLTNSLDTAVRQDTAFIKVITSGQYIKLLYHADDNKHRYFILENGTTQPWELNFYQYINDNDHIINYSPFISQLRKLLKKYNVPNENLTRNLDDNDYTEDVFIKFARLINKDQSSKISHSSGSRLFIGGGINYNYAIFNGPPGFGFATTYSSIAPLVDIGIDFLNNPNIQRSFFRLEANLSTISPKFTGDIAYFDSKQLLFTISPQFVFNLYNTEKLKYFLGICIDVTLTSVSDSKLTATQGGVILTPVQLQNKGDSYQSLQPGQSINKPYDFGSISEKLELKTGLVFNKNVEVYLGVTPLAIGSSYNSYNYKNLGGIVGFNYLFGPAKNK